MENFLETLNRECERLLPFALAVGLLAWLPYVRLDSRLHPDLSVLTWLRFGLTALSLILIFARLFANFRYRALILGTVFLLFLEVAAGVIAGLTGADSVYLGGFALLLLIIPLAPLPAPVLYSTIGFSILGFGVSLAFRGLPELDLESAYSRNNFLMAVLLSAVFTYMIGGWRRRNWQRANDLQQARTDLQQLNDFSRRVSFSNRLPAIVDEVFRYVTERHGCDAAVIMFVDAQETVAVYSDLLPENLTREQVSAVRSFRTSLNSHRTLSRIYNERFPVTVTADVTNSDDALFGFGTFLCLPLIADNRVIGFLAVCDTRRPEGPSVTEINGLQMLCRQIAGAIYQHRLLHEARLAERQAHSERERAEELRQETEDIGALIKQINEQRSLSAIIRDLFTFLERRFRFSGLALLTVDDRQNRLRSAEVFGTHVPEAALQYARTLDVPLDATGGTLSRVFHRKRAIFFREKRTVVADTRATRAHRQDRALLEGLQAASFLMLPLVMREEPIGMLLMTDYSDRMHLSREDKSALERIGNQIAGAVHTALLLEELRTQQQNVKEARRQIEYMSLVARHISEASQLDEALSIVINHLSEAFGIQHFALYRLSPDRNWLELVRENLTANATPEEKVELYDLRIPADPNASIQGAVCATRTARYFRRIRGRNLKASAEQRFVELFGMHSLLMVPLVRGNETIGAIHFTNGPVAPLTLSRNQVEAVTRFCDYVAGSLHTFALLKEMESSRRRSENLRSDLIRLNNFARELNALNGYGEVVASIYDYARLSFKAKHIWLVMVDSGARRFRLELPTGDEYPAVPGERSATIPLDKSAGLQFQVYRRRRLLHARKAARFSRFLSEIDRQLVESFDLEDLLYAPLVVQNRVVGMLGLSGLPVPISRSNQRIHLEAFSEQAASALDRTQLAARSAADRRRMAQVGEMAAGIVHDLKNPMTTIKAYAEMSDSDVGRERRRKYLETIGKEVDRLVDMSYDILEFAKGNYTLEFTSCDLDRFVHDLLEPVQPDLEKHGIKVELSFDQQRPVFLDRARFRRAVSNLVSNAIDALTRVPRARRRLTLTARTADAWVELRCRDTGPGLPESVQQNLYEEFVTHGKEGGTGLGLSIAKSIVEAHRGFLSCESSSADGTEFLIRIPADLGTEDSPASKSDMERRARERRQRKDRRRAVATSTE